MAKWGLVLKNSHFPFEPYAARVRWRRRAEQRKMDREQRRRQRLERQQECGHQDQPTGVR